MSETIGLDPEEVFRRLVLGFNLRVSLSRTTDTFTPLNHTEIIQRATSEWVAKGDTFIFSLEDWLVDLVISNGSSSCRKDLLEQIRPLTMFLLIWFEGKGKPKPGSSNAPSFLSL